MHRHSIAVSYNHPVLEITSTQEYTLGNIVEFGLKRAQPTRIGLFLILATPFSICRRWPWCKMYQENTSLYWIYILSSNYASIDTNSNKLIGQRLCNYYIQIEIMFYLISMHMCNCILTLESHIISHSLPPIAQPLFSARSRQRLHRLCSVNFR